MERFFKAEIIISINDDEMTTTTLNYELRNAMEYFDIQKIDISIIDNYKEI